jgi:hypothetical protein
MFVLCLDDRLFRDIRHLLGRGLIFLYQLAHQDLDVGLLMANAEGEYQVLIHGLIDNLQFMNFSEQEGEFRSNYSDRNVSCKQPCLNDS